MKKRIKENYELITIGNGNRIKKFRRRIGWISRDEIIILYCLDDDEIDSYVKVGKIRKVTTYTNLGFPHRDMFFKSEIEEVILRERKSLEAEMDMLLEEI